MKNQTICFYLIRIIFFFFNPTDVNPIFKFYPQSDTQPEVLMKKTKNETGTELIELLEKKKDGANFTADDFNNYTKQNINEYDQNVDEKPADSTAPRGNMFTRLFTGKNAAAKSGGKRTKRNRRINRKSRNNK